MYHIYQEVISKNKLVQLRWTSVSQNQCYDISCLLLWTLATAIPGLGYVVTSQLLCGLLKHLATRNAVSKPVTELLWVSAQCDARGCICLYIGCLQSKQLLWVVTDFPEKFCWMKPPTKTCSSQRTPSFIKQTTFKYRDGIHCRSPWT